jgi:hypothetical protein
MGVLSLAGCAGEDGDTYNYYTQGRILINAPEDLAKIGRDASYPLSGEYTLTANMTLTDWTPIGNDIEPFTGTFTGNNRTITLSSFYSGAAADRYLGIFAYVDGATIGDVKVVYNVPVITGTAEADTYTGTLAAYAKSSQLTDITVSGTLSLTNQGIEGDDGVNVAVYGGGIAGYVVDTMFTRCASSVGVTVIGNGNSSAGGIAGGASNTEVATARFISCSSTGAITATWHTGGGISNYGMLYAGGIIGNTWVTWGGTGYLFENCYTTGNVTANSALYPYAGGITGYSYASSQIKACYATGAITATATATGTGYVGGIAGINSSSSIIENSYARGNVRLTGPGHIGGIAGQNGSSGSIIQYCYATGTITSDTATANVGGIAGQNYNNAGTEVKANAALNAKIEVVASTTYAHRVVGMNGHIPWGEEEMETGLAKVTNNIAYVTDTTNIALGEKSADSVEGADSAATPIWTDYSTLGWRSSVWETTIPAGGYPVLAWQP